MTQNTLILAKIGLHADSPFAVQSGAEQGIADNQILLDANLLPYLPATSVIGVWRHLCADIFGDEVAQRWFGDGSARAVLSLTNGYILDSHRRPVVGMRKFIDVKRDSLLANVFRGGHYEHKHNRINDRGVVADGALFTHMIVPAGLMFSLKLRAIISSDYLDEFNDVLGLLQHPLLHIGSKTRNGLGKMSLALDFSWQRQIPLSPTTQAQAKALGDFDKDWHQIAIPNGAMALTLSEKRNCDVLCAIPIRTQGPWTMGQGSESAMTDPNLSGNEHTTTQVSYSYQEPYWNWQTARFEKRVWALGSTLKGIFRHRLQYHLQCLGGHWADDLGSIESPLIQHEAFQQGHPLLLALMGDMHGNNESNHESSAGMLFFADCVISYSDKQVMTRTHNVIDKFTGGVKDKALFTQEIIEDAAFNFKVVMHPNAYQLLTDHPILAKAIHYTLLDIQTGRLPLGSHAGRGYSNTQLDRNVDSSLMVIHALIGQALSANSDLVAS